VGEPLTGFDSRVEDVEFSPDGRTLAASRFGEEVRLWDTGTRQPLGRPLEGHNIAFRPDGASLAATTWDGTAQIWSL
jgi:WD40 repeat protein